MGLFQFQLIRQRKFLVKLKAQPEIMGPGL